MKPQPETPVPPVQPPPQSQARKKGLSIQRNVNEKERQRFEALLRTKFRRKI